MKAWLHSLVAAAISAFSTSVLTLIVDPVTFNFTLKGFEHIGAVAGLSALLSVLSLLKQSPLPTSTSPSTLTIPLDPNRPTGTQKE